MDKFINNEGKTRLFVSAIIFAMSVLSAFEKNFYSSPAAIVLVATTLFAAQLFETAFTNFNPGVVSKSAFVVLCNALIVLMIANSNNVENLQAYALASTFAYLCMYCIAIEKHKQFFWTFFGSTVLTSSTTILFYTENQNISLIAALGAFALSCFGFVIHTNYVPLSEKLEQAHGRAEIMATITRFSREFHTREPEEVIRNIVSVTKQLGYISSAIVSFDRRSKIVEDGARIDDLLLYAEKSSALRRVVIETKSTETKSRKSTHKIKTDIAAAPIWFNSRYSAALIVQSAPGVSINENDAAALELLADQAGRALENAAKSASDRRAVERLLDESQRDKLTNLGNRRYADIMVSTLEQGDVLAMIDVDGLKSTNDKFGHEAGDQLLQSIGAFLSEEIRTPDLCARLGGDEFIILLKNAEVGADQILNRLIKMWQEKHLFATTLSIGMSVHRNHRDVQETIKAADTALYQAKHQGKNQLVSSKA